KTRDCTPGGSFSPLHRSAICLWCRFFEFVIACIRVPPASTFIRSICVIRGCSPRQREPERNHEYDESNEYGAVRWRGAARDAACPDLRCCGQHWRCIIGQSSSSPENSIVRHRPIRRLILFAFVLLLANAAPSFAALEPDEIAILAVRTSRQSRELAEHY